MEKRLEHERAYISSRGGKKERIRRRRRRSSRLAHAVVVSVAIESRVQHLHKTGGASVAITFMLLIIDAVL